MKHLKIISISLTGIFLVSCQPDPVYYPVFVPVQKDTPKKTTYKPKPKPVESAEGFRAVEKPTTYSN